MSIARRDVLKMLTAAPFVGLSGAPPLRQAAGTGPASAPSDSWRVFDPPFLQEIAFPLGGIGTGTVSLGGRGNLRDWEIANRPDKGRDLDNTFFSLWFRRGSRAPRTMILESELTPPYRGAFGIPRGQLPGMPRFRSARFLGSYPFARLELSDPRVPLEVSLECFNPFIPGNDKDSGIPVALFYWHLRNNSDATIEATVMASLQNMAGVDTLGGNLNRFVDEGALRGLHMTTRALPPEHPDFGSLALSTVHGEITYATRWDRGEWFDAQSLFWEDFSADGRVEPVPESDPTPEGRTDVGSLGGLVSLAPAETATVPFVLSWHFPNRQNYWLSEIFGYDADRTGPIIGNWYQQHFGDAWDVARYTSANLERLERETRLFHDALFSTTAPPEILDAVSSQSSIIRTETCFRTQDGRFYAFEGTGDDHGCCPLNCTHVWNYEQTLAFLFPALERSMREVDFGHNTDDDGFMVFRSRIPLGTPKWDFPHAAADGQMGTVIKLYRDWQLSGDLEFLRRLWPKAQDALEFAWKDWDPDRDGVMEGVQHNTYDIEFHGPNPMMGAVYLTALKCGADMARAVGDNAAAATYDSLAARGRDGLDQETWNGEYYVQAYDRAQEEKYQVGAGCLSDQLLGQWMAHVVDQGHVLPRDHVRSAIHAVYEHNFKETFEDHANPQRIFALGDEGGLLLCSWPRGNRPLLPFVYSDEVWTGIEYQVAAHLIYEGYVDEGVRIVRAVRNRYDGQRRNPWNEVECGNHYARALASWSLLLALSGFHYSAPEKRMGFAPKSEAGRFASFWSAEPGFGLYEQERDATTCNATLRLLYGKGLELETFELAVLAGTVRAEVSLDGEQRDANVTVEGDKTRIHMERVASLRPGSELRIRLAVS
jgi:uncharacterized protein (DUF608 family)